MNHIDFIFWMIVYPFTITISQTIDYKWGRGKQYSENAVAFASLANTIIWLVVGLLLFNNV
jgi:hypothetical protein